MPLARAVLLSLTFLFYTLFFSLLIILRVPIDIQSLFQALEAVMIPWSPWLWWQFLENDIFIDFLHELLPGWILTNRMQFAWFDARCRARMARSHLTLHNYDLMLEEWLEERRRIRGPLEEARSQANGEREAVREREFIRHRGILREIDEFYEARDSDEELD
ncbi:hypothetical protein EAF04_010596 [Stromatinia cepivora]|nr:hypothetical protein EAF04_010596 [Stromatinia cepivora]